MWEVDDLTEKRCAGCGTDRELTRPISLVVDGVFFGEIVCEPCEALRSGGGPRGS